MPLRAGFDPSTGTYIDARATRGFPMGGIGAGGFTLATDGGFGEFRWNNNWMCPIRNVRGAFHALFVAQQDRRRMVMLRRAREDEYAGVEPVRSTIFAGMPPAFALAFEDELPVEVALEGFTPHVPHDVRDSTLPAAVFRFRIESRSDAPCDVAVLFALENLLGRGGTGHLGVELGPAQELTGVRARIVYDGVAGDFQEAAAVGVRRGVRFRTTQRWDARAHRAGVVGEYLLLAEPAPGLEITVCDGFDAGGARPFVLDDFARDGRIESRQSGRLGDDEGHRPAAAVAARTRLAGRAVAEIVFVLAWWTPDHVTEPALAVRGTDGPHDGTRVGHVYECHFASVDAVAAHVLDHRRQLEHGSTEVTALLEASTLPHWLVRALGSSIDSTLCNTIVPASGRMYTLEGLDWHWPMGGLTGTNDQRLSAHPYTSVFFTDLDVTELDEFRRLADARGAIPHGNGNCDLGLGTTDVPYGWPMFIKDFLPAKEWTDLTMSFVLQAGKLWRTTGDRDLLDRFWPAMVRGMEYLSGIAPHGVPEGGTTYDVWDFPGTFVYTATLYLAALRTMQDAARAADPSLAGRYEERYTVAARRTDTLWDARGFYRSCETIDSIFTAALAGDWAARYAGLDPVVDPSRAARHLRHQHRVLVEGAERASARHPALPWSEATFDGEKRTHRLAAGLSEGEEFTYVWQVLSYQAMEQVYLGEVAAGLETMRRFYERLWDDGHAWSGGLRGNGESVYMTHPVIWAVTNALTGAALDVPGRALHLSPRTGGEIAHLVCPFFFPAFWAVLHYRPGAGRMTVEVVRTFGEPVEIDRVVHRPLAGPVRVHELGRTRMTIGTRFTVATEEGST
ncbi:MAG TPA: GH116 family glycosyl-hydrolase [Candidatus Eisenbacteria bacterium]|nr:GH116 family glycosyl-hydrolase [Candidatus Eisenbacteria bacterium]